MLEFIAIRNLALIDEVELEPAAGLTVVSGQTGGGKTLLVQALSLLRGGRARAGLVRAGAKAACIDGVFRLAGGGRSEELVALHREVLGVEPEDGRIRLARIVDVSGRSRARVSGRPVSLADFRRFGERLLEIHGQGENRALMRPEVQTEMLDRWAGLEAERRAFAAELAEARALAKRLAERRARAAEGEERRAFLRYRLDEIAKLAPEPGELAELRAEVSRLEHLDRLRAGVGDCLAAVAGGGGESAAGAGEAVGRAARLLAGLAELDPELESAAGILDEAQVLLGEAERELERALARLDLDPARLEERRARLLAYEELLRRYGPGEEELFAARARLAAELAELEGGGADPAALETELEERLAGLERRGRALTRARRAAGRRLEQKLRRELADLGMAKARVRVTVAERRTGPLLERADAWGLGPVALDLAANPGEPAVPLAEAASGGEVARTMLAFKKVLADADRVPVIVFDEIESGIGARLGFAVGRKLAELARSHQVICVTHLPQVAAFGARHWLVEKEVRGRGEGTRTRSRVRLLAGEERRRELAAMSPGARGVDEGALSRAAELLAAAQSASKRSSSASKGSA